MLTDEEAKIFFWSILSLTLISFCQVVQCDHFLSPVCNLDFFHILSPPCFGTSLPPPLTDKTSVVYSLQLLVGNTNNVHFFLSFLFLVNFQKIIIALEDRNWAPGWFHRSPDRARAQCVNVCGCVAVTPTCRPSNRARFGSVSLLCHLGTDFHTCLCGLCPRQEDPLLLLP